MAISSIDIPQEIEIPQDASSYFRSSVEHSCEKQNKAKHIKNQKQTHNKTKKSKVIT